MAKELEADGNIIDSQTAEDKKDDHDEGSSNEAMETRTLIFLDGQFMGKTDEPLVNKVETTSAEHGLKETTEIRLKSGSGCAHILHTGAELGSSCVSCTRLNKEPLILCSECAKDPDNFCYVCNSICCWQCRDQRWLDGEMRVVCRACIRTTLRIRLLKHVIKWLIIAAALYYLLMF